MRKRMTLALPEDVVSWARRQSSTSKMSMSRYVVSLLEREMQVYPQSMSEALAKKNPKLGSDATSQMPGDETHER